ncbi:MAG: histidine phosphatase family protein [Candidatus Wallbacteria bacterium]|nr:histidine phosphatase family protein [Candidatus Wallbacteria bacterium]
MTRHIFLVRHGQAVSNLSREYSEWVHGPDGLTPLGLMQARQAARALLAVMRPGYRLISSPLERARQTAEILAEGVAPDATLYLDERLQEKTPSESFDDAARRAWQALWDHSSQGGVLCVTHGHVIQALAALSLGFDDITRLHPFNCGITYFRDGRLVAFNMSLHLVGEERSVEELD